MKFWNSFGSEHSMNLVMIGRFEETRDAHLAKELIDSFSAQVASESHSPAENESGERFSPEMMALFQRAGIYTIGPVELEQFVYDVSVELKGKTIELRTDESEVSAFLKLLIEKGARVEVYSAHDYPDAAANDG